jgi:hypothetical protein
MADDLFPEHYLRGPRLEAYDSLLGAKLYWLILKKDFHASALGVDRRQLREQGEETPADVKARIDAHAAAIAESEEGIKVLSGNDMLAKRALVKEECRGLDS